MSYSSHSFVIPTERNFDSRPVEQEKLDKILEARRIVPTACNYQPQRFFVLKSEQALAAAKSVTPFTYKAPLMILVCYAIPRNTFAQRSSARRVFAAVRSRKSTL